MKTSDKILAISAIFISACALFVSIYQTRILSMEKDAAVWPYLRIETSWQPDRFILSIANDGIGPALIQEVTYELGDTIFYRIDHVIAALVEKDTLLKNDLKNYSYANIESYGTAMRAGESTNILEVVDVPNRVIKKLQEYIYVEKIKVTIDYCSIYKKCWRNEDNKIIEVN